MQEHIAFRRGTSRNPSGQTITHHQIINETTIRITTVWRLTTNNRWVAYMDVGEVIAPGACNLYAQALTTARSSPHPPGEN